MTDGIASEKSRAAIRDVLKSFDDMAPESLIDETVNQLDGILGAVFWNRRYGIPEGISLRVEDRPDQGNANTRFTVLDLRGGHPKHLVFNSYSMNDGLPRPTTPGAYQDPERPGRIYTLMNAGGGWRLDTSPGLALSLDEVPDKLIFLGAL